MDKKHEEIKPTNVPDVKAESPPRKKVKLSTEVTDNPSDSLTSNVPNEIVVKMEDIDLRFPHITAQIFDYLDNKALTNCREASTSWYNILDRKKFFWIRMIKACINNQKEFKELWISLLKKSSTETVRELAIAVHKKRLKLKNLGGSPLHFAVLSGQYHIFMDVFEKVEHKILSNARGGLSPLHVASITGSLKIFTKLFKHAGNKNTETKYRWTALHFAAYTGRYTICQFLLENSKDKNPKTNTGTTPLHAAYKKAHIINCKLLL